MALPANISTRWIEGQFLTNVNDGPDPDQQPDGIAARGTVTFVAAVPYLPDATAVPNPATLLMIPRVAVLDEEGYICTPVRGTLTPAYRGIMLECTDDPDGSVTGWTWNVKYAFMPVDGVTPTIDSHSFPLPTSDVALDLTTVVKVPSSAGIGKEQAEVLAASAQAAAVRAAADAAKAMAAAEEALGAAEATDSNVSSLVGTEGTETNAAVARQVESAAASKLDADEAASTYQSIDGLDAVAASKVNAENSSLRQAVDARAQAAASSKLDATEATDRFATKDSLDGIKAVASDAGVAELIAGNTETSAALTATINKQVDPRVQQVAADYIAGDRAVVDAAAAAVNANPKIAELQNGAVLPTSADFHAITVGGLHKMQGFPVDWQAQNMPTPLRGTLQVEPFGAGRILLYKTFEAVPRILRQSLFGGAWGPWEDINADTLKLRDGVELADTSTVIPGLPPGKYRVAFFPPASSLAPLVGVRGAVEVTPMNATGTSKVLTYATFEEKPRYFVGTTSASVWRGWREIGGTGGNGAPASNAAPTPASGLKVVPLNVTIGGGSAVEAPTTGTFRYPIKWNAPLLRVRVCMQNVAPISGNIRTGAVNLGGVWVGKHAANGAYSAAPRRVAGAATTPADGSVHKTGWFWLDQTPGTEDLLSISYTAASGTIVGSTIANGWRSVDPADAGAIAPTMSATATMPFFVWLEAETYATTPHVAGFGDSLTSGVGSGGPMHSWLALYCERARALPTHYSNSGDTLQSWASDFESYKWRVFEGLAKPDALIWAIGSNDLFGGLSVEQVKANYAAVFPVMSERVSRNIYLANIMPRTATEGESETRRRAYNDWLTGLPMGARDIFNFRDAMSNDDETIRPEFNADGVHLNRAGYEALAATITRPVTSPPVTYQQV